MILTHAHPDHLGGNLDAEGRPAYPNARYVVSKAEWDFWTSGPDLAELAVPDELRRVLAEFARASLRGVQRQVDLVASDAEVVPGVRVAAAPGHTPGQLVVEVESEGERLLDVADVVLHPIHLERPDWYAVVDFSPEQTVATRRRVMSQAADQRALVFGLHFAFPALGHVERAGDTWKWQAVG